MTSQSAHLSFFSVSSGIATASHPSTRDYGRMEEEILVFAGSASRKLAGKICDELGLELRRGETLRFSEGSLFVRILENVRGRHVYLVQGTVFPTNDHFMELLFW